MPACCAAARAAASSSSSRRRSASGSSALPTPSPPPRSAGGGVSQSLVFSMRYALCVRPGSPGLFHANMSFGSIPRWIATSSSFSHPFV